MRPTRLVTGSVARRRLSAVVAVPLVVAAGLGVRAAGAGAVASGAGDALYAVLVYTLVVVLGPRWRPVAAALTALAVCWLVELSQLTGLPADLADAWWPARYVLGTSFVWTDLVLYTLGVLVAVAVDRSVVAWRDRASGGGVSSAGIVSPDEPIGGRPGQGSASGTAHLSGEAALGEVEPGRPRGETDRR